MKTRAAAVFAALLLVASAVLLSTPTASAARRPPRPTTSTAPPTTTTSATTTTVAPPPPGGYVQPGSVGYLGDPAALTVIDPTHPYAGTGGSTWTSSGHRFTQTNLTLDHVRIQGPMVWTGTGTLTVTNSIVEGGNGQPYTIWVDAPTATTVTLADTTLRYPGAFPVGSDSANLSGNARFVQNITRCDISGQPHGVEVTASGSVVDSTWIHGLVWNPSSDPHLDGIFVFGGANVRISNNNIAVGDANSIHTTAALFLQNTFGWGISAPAITGNYLNGGASSLYAEAGSSATVRDNTIAVGVYGDVDWSAPAPAVWTGNHRPDGTVIPSP